MTSATATRAITALRPIERGVPGALRLLAPLAVALVAAVAYLWNLEVSGYANTYYSAAAQAGSQSWSAWFFGSLDAAGFITVDKPPASLWLMGLSVRLLGLSPFAILLPQALAGVASAVLLYATVRRSFGAAAGLVAGVAFALTPVAALMFRYNNPDALLTLLLIAAAWMLVRGLEDGRPRWPLTAAAMVGLAFLTKYLQAYLVLPAFALTYLVAAPGAVRRRLAVLGASAAVLTAASAWWVVVVDLLPRDARPYIGGSSDGTALDLILGYDGLGRILGQAGPAGGGAPGGPGAGPGAGFGGAPGWLRMLNGQWGGQVAWLLPLAAIGLAVGLASRFRASRLDARRAGYLLWGGWGITHLAVFSLMTGIVHPYYAVSLAPAVAALAGAGIVELWRLRRRVAWGGLALGASLVLTAWWGWQLLERTPSFLPGIGVGALATAIAAAIVLAVPPVRGDLRAARIASGAAVVGLGAILLGPALYTGATMTRSLSGGDPAAGPSATAGRDGGPGGFGAFVGDDAGTNAALVEYLLDNRGDATWLIAVSSANQAGPLQLASGVPVMAMGGFMGSDPVPTLDELQGYVRDGSLRFVIVGGRDGGPGGFFGGDGSGSVSSGRTAWVTAACAPVEISGIAGTLYDCAEAAA